MHVLCNISVQNFFASLLCVGAIRAETFDQVQELRAHGNKFIVVSGAFDASLFIKDAAATVQFVSAIIALDWHHIESCDL